MPCLAQCSAIRASMSESEAAFLKPSDVSIFAVAICYWAFVGATTVFAAMSR